MEKSIDFLKTFNRKIFEEMKRDDIQLIGDISLDNDSYRQLEEALYVVWERDYRYYGRLYKESLILLLVKNAERHYSGSFWEHLKINFNLNQRSYTRKLFLEVCERHGFPTFETEAEEGYGIITPYICHSGIPNDELSDFFAVFESYFDSRNVQAFLNLIDQRSHLVRSHTRRFLTYLAANQFPFLLQWDEVTRVYNDHLTAEDVFKLVKMSFEGESVLIPIRFIKQYINWQRMPSEQPGRKPTERHRYRSPQIALDFDTGCLALNIPEQDVPQKLNPGYLDKLVWIIEFAGKTKRIETFIYKNVLSNNYFTDAESVKLHQPDSLDDSPGHIHVQVCFNDVNQFLQTWELAFAADRLIVFDESGKMIHNNQVSKKEFILFAAEYYKVISGYVDLEADVVFWPNYKLHAIRFGDFEAITVEDGRSSKKYTIERKPGLNIPELQGGAVFHNNPFVYEKLPLLVFPDIPDDSLSVEITHYESKDKKIVEPVEKETVLSNVVNVARYGTYVLRVRQDKKTIDRKRFYYIPKIDFVDEGDYWPKPGEGYNPDSYYRFETNEDIRIEIDGLAKENELVEAGKRKVWFRAEKQNTRPRGRISFYSEFSGGELSVAFQMTARPILWAIESASDASQLKYTDKPIYFTDEQIRALKEPYLFLAAGDLGSASLQGQLFVTDRQGNHIFNTDFQLKNGGAFSFPLLNLLLSDALQNVKQYQIGIQLFSPFGEMIGGSSYPLVTVSPTIKFSHFHVELQDHSVNFSWLDNGELTERGMFLTDLTRPWEKVRYFPVFEDQTSIMLPHSELKSGIYSAKIDIPKRQSPFGKLYFEPTVWSVFFAIQAPNDDEKSDPVASFNYYWFSYLLSEQDDTNAIQQRKSSPIPVIKDARQAMNLVKTYLTIRAIETQMDHWPDSRKQKFHTLERVYRNLARQVGVPTREMLEFILKEGFSPKDYFDVFSFFEIVQLTDREIQLMNWFEVIRRISDQMPDLAFQIAMAMNSYYQYVERWVGRNTLNELLELRQGEDPIETMRDRFENDRKMKVWASHPDYWGSYQDVVDFFDKYYVDMYRSRFKKMDYQEYLAFYESEYKKGTRKLFDKSFIRKRQDIQHEITNNADRYSKLLKHLEDCVKNDIRPHFSELERSFPTAMSRINDFERHDTVIAEEIIYNAYLIMFVVTLYRQGKWSHRYGLLLRNADRVRRYFPEMYNHTLVVFDLYLRDGGT